MGRGWEAGEAEGGDVAAHVLPLGVSDDEEVPDGGRGDRGLGPREGGKGGSGVHVGVWVRGKISSANV